MNKYLNKKQLTIYCLLPIALLTIELFFTIFINSNKITIQSILFTLSFALFFNSFNFLFNSKKAILIYSTIIISIISTLALTQVMYFNYFADYYSFTSIANLRELFIVKGEMTNAININMLVFIIIPIISYFILKKTLNNNKKSKKIFAISLLCFILLFNVTKITFNKNIESDDLYSSDTYLYSNLFNKERAANTFGIISYSYRDLVNIAKNTLNIKNKLALQNIDMYFKENVREKEKNDKTGIYEDKNVVLVLVESLNPWGIDELVSPTLYKMATQGIYFENYHAPTFQSSTADAEFAINTGLCPSIDFGPTAYNFHENYYPTSLAYMFKEKGYSANSFHNSKGAFYNRYKYHNSFGYDKFYAAEELEIPLPEKFGYEWPKDFDLFEKSSKIILDTYDESQPFLSYLITVSTHMPYNSYRKNLKDELKLVSQIYPDVSSNVAYYLAGAMDLDNGLTHMVEEFKKNEILDDTVFVIIADHYSYGMDEEIIWEHYDKYEDNKLKLSNVPFLIWTPGIESEVVSEKCSQFDVHPTISNLFNLDNDLTYAMGNDIFSNETNTIIYGSRNTWEDDNILYDNNQTITKFNKDIVQNYAINKNHELIKKINTFQYILKDDYFNSSIFKKSQIHKNKPLP